MLEALGRRGRYRAGQLAGVSREQLTRGFVKQPQTGDEASYEVSPELKQHVTFARLNLAQPPFPMKGPFDAVLCRNVMIYFDAPVRQGLVREMERLVRPGGLVMVGHSETLSGLETALQVVAPSVYRRSGG